MAVAEEAAILDILKDELDEDDGPNTRGKAAGAGAKPKKGIGRGRQNQNRDDGDDLAQTQKKLLDARILLVHLKTQIEQQKSEIAKLQRAHSSRSKLMPTKYNGKTDFDDYLSQFEPIA